MREPATKNNRNHNQSLATLDRIKQDMMSVVAEKEALDPVTRPTNYQMDSFTKARLQQLDDELRRLFKSWAEHLAGH